MILAGIDEAGFGPVLGPLVVSASAFEAPDELADVPLWQLLAGALSRSPARKRTRVVINDSKKLYSGLRGGSGLELLEGGVLSMLAVAGMRPGLLSELLELLCAGAWRRAIQEPWNAGADLKIPHAAQGEGIALAANAVSAAVDQRGLRMLPPRCEPVFAGEYNRLVSAVDNKSLVLFDVSARLMDHIWRQTPPGSLARIVVDRQGGRMRYLDGLQRVFPDCRFKVLDETDTFSGYRMTCGERVAEIHFLVESESRHLPVALASMISKYVRELLMVLFNRFWGSRVPNLAPTAGYYADGNRFYRQIEPAVRQLGIEPGALYRSR